MAFGDGFGHGLFPEGLEVLGLGLAWAGLGGVVPSMGRWGAGGTVGVRRWMKPSAIWISGYGLLAANTGVAGVCGRGIALPFQSDALQRSQARQLSGQTTLPWRS